MSLLLNKRADSPGLIYTHAETGHKQHAWDINTLMGLIKKYRVDNSFTPVSQEDVEEQICQTLPPDWCHYSTGGAPTDFIDLQLTPDDVIRGTAALGEIAARRAASMLVPSWTPFVEQEEAERRAAICAGCYAKTTLSGCRSCDGFVAAIKTLIGGRQTKADNVLAAHACAVCKCSASAQVHVKAEILAKGVDEKMMAKYSQIEHCWKFKELQALTTEGEAPNPPQ